MHNLPSPSKLHTHNEEALRSSLLHHSNEILIACNRSKPLLLLSPLSRQGRDAGPTWCQGWVGSPFLSMAQLRWWAAGQASQWGCHVGCESTPKSSKSSSFSQAWTNYLLQSDAWSSKEAGTATKPQLGRAGKHDKEAAARVLMRTKKILYCSGEPKEGPGPCACVIQQNSRC